MSINLPGYGTAGWGATLNNYLRNLEKRLNVIEGKVNSNSTVEEQILAVSRYAGSGLTNTFTTIKHKDPNDAITPVTGTYALSGSGKLIFENLSYYIAASLTNSGGSHITFDTAKEWTYDSSSKGNLGTTNQSLLLVIDQYGVFSVLPHIVNGNPTNTSATNLNFCRLGYITKIGDSVFFTPAPEIASINSSSKFDFWSNPKIKTERQNSNTDYVNNFTFNAEGLGYCKNASSVNNILINDFDILNSLRYEIGVTDGYYTINSSGLQNNGSTSAFGSVDNITWTNKTIRAYYVTLTGKIFCYIYSLGDETMPITSQELGAYQIPRSGSGENTHPLFDNYAFICPVEVFRLAKNEYGTIISYSNTYNGFPPQLHNTPVFGSNNAVKWNQFHFMQEAATLNSTSTLPLNTLRIKPIVNTKTGSNNPIVTIDTTDSTTGEDDEILLMEHDYKKALNIKSSGAVYINSNTFSFSGSYGSLNARDGLSIETDDFYMADSDDNIKLEMLAYNDDINSPSFSIAGVLCITDNQDLSATNYAQSGQIWYQNNKLKLAGSEGVIVDSSLKVSGKTIIDDNLNVKGTVTWTSDRNLKTNITPMAFNSTEFVDSIPLYNYALKSTPNNQTIGLMAQDLQEYLPQLVHKAQDGHLTIEETKLVYICIDALKQANQRIELLEDKVNDLCNKISQYHL